MNTLEWVNTGILLVLGVGNFKTRRVLKREIARVRTYLHMQHLAATSKTENHE